MRLGGCTLLTGLLLLATFGCKTPHSGNAETLAAPAPASAKVLSVEIIPGADGKLALRSTPDLSPTPAAAPSDGMDRLSCSERQETPDGERYECRRGVETLYILHHFARRTVILDYAPGGMETDPRIFYRCAYETAEPLGQAALTFPCSLATASERIGGLFVSPFPPDKNAPRIRNGHVVAAGTEGPLLFRGMLPRSEGDFNELVKFKVDAVLVFKTDDSGQDLKDEKAGIDRASGGQIAVTHIPFAWKDFKSDFQKPCRQTIDALIVLRDNALAGKRVFFHCTVGEDRTGFLAGLYRMLDPTQQWSAAKAFKEELCENGFSAGNAKKPYTIVVKPINEGLAPLFVEFAAAIESKRLTIDNLSPAGYEFCNQVAPKQFTDRQAPWGGSVDCPPSVRYLPNLDGYDW